MPSMSSITNFPPMKMATPALVSNISKQIGIQKVAPNGIFNNTGSQIGVQVRHKKWSAQLKNYRSQIHTNSPILKPMLKSTQNHTSQIYKPKSKILHPKPNATTPIWIHLLSILQTCGDPPSPRHVSLPLC